MLLVNNRFIGLIKYGTKNIKAVYSGNRLVWSLDNPTGAPYDREVECLIADDVDTYLVTDIKIVDSTKYKFEIKGGTGLGSTMLFGVRNTTSTSTNQGFNMLHSAAGAYGLRVMHSANVVSFTSSDTNQHTFIWDGSNLTFSMDGVVKKVSSPTSSIYRDLTSDFGLCLFGCNSGGIIDNMGTPRTISYFKCWYEGELIADYIPVIDNNRIPCFYDRVSEKLRRCSGDGTFKFIEKEEVVR